MNSCIGVAYFTNNGQKMYEKLHIGFGENIYLRDNSQTLAEWTKKCFADNIPIVFIGATGIAVRTIAPLLECKTKDPAVLVMDELGKYVIPLVSGHLGGANELALRISEITGAEPVITTATDINECFSPDLFAKENNLAIADKDSIRTVAGKALENKPVTVSIKDYPPREKVDIIISNMKSDIENGSMLISPKEYCIGIGCKKNTEYEVIIAAVNKALEDINIDISQVFCIASIDIKENEPGILRMSRLNKIPFITFDADLLNKVQGEFTTSEYVKSQVGVDNVCERAAVLGAGIGAVLVLRKQAGNGVTVAIAKRYMGMN